MHILVNAVPMTRVKTGIARYIDCLYTEMARIPGIRVTYFTGNRTVPVMPVPANPLTFARKAASFSKLPLSIICLLRTLYWKRHDHLLHRALRYNSYDIYHETRFIPAQLNDMQIPMVTTVYDLSLIAFRNTHPRDRVWLFDRYFSSRIRDAVHIVTISEYIKNQIIAEFSLPPPYVSSVQLAAAAHFRPLTEIVAKRMTRDLNLPNKFYLFVGCLEPRKNLVMLLDALSRTSTDVPLIIAGWGGWEDEGLLSKMINTGLKNRVVRLGHVEDHLLPAVYSRAAALVYPSVYEGFGLPVLEAMACGCPVICSNAAALPEVAGDAAILLNPEDVDSWAEALTAVIKEERLRKELVSKGLNRARQFSWQRSAEETYRVLGNAMQVQNTFTSCNFSKTPGK